MFVCPGAKNKALTQERDRFLTDEWPKIRERISILGLSLGSLLEGQET
jgi:GntR family transcriptional regulator